MHLVCDLFWCLGYVIIHYYRRKRGFFIFFDGKFSIYEIA